uniref:Uncharacterized protein n=1 Tax=Gossypium raimondii TaxID=29730 RepID=A0A0D2PKY3_GOSRA|nr:hypothetical protein B456_008G087700 [Gossypium raimondii]
MQAVRCKYIYIVSNVIFPSCKKVAYLFRLVCLHAVSAISNGSKMTDFGCIPQCTKAFCIRDGEIACNESCEDKLSI